MLAAPTLLPIMPVTAVAAAALPPMVVATLPATAAKAGAASPPASQEEDVASQCCRGEHLLTGGWSCLSSALRQLQECPQLPKAL